MAAQERARAEPSDAVDPARERDVLLGLCYRLLGSIADAEDAVQETYVRWYRLSDAERQEVASPRAWLIKAASRIGLDMLGSARARRESYVGEWLPEPLPGEALWSSPAAASADAVDPAERVSLDESVSMALLIVLESMTPAERVAFVLHDVFRYPFGEVAEIVGRSPEACRQLASSARRRVRDSRATPVDPAAHDAVVRSFQAAWQTGDLAALVDLLDPEATAVADGGGLVPAARKPIRGAETIVRALLHGRERRPDVAVRAELVNGVLGLVATEAGRTVAVITVEVADGRIRGIWAVTNPEKLRVWNEAAAE